jgi:hypothetical protein
MENTLQVAALYEAAKVDGRGKFCPRKGIYLILDVYQGSCYGKTAVMAKAHWKANTSDDYNEDYIFDVQLESVSSDNLFIKQLWKDKEMLIREATYDSQMMHFSLTWELLNVKTIGLAHLNRLLSSRNTNIVSSLLESTEGIDVDGIDDGYEIDDTYDV